MTVKAYGRCDKRRRQECVPNGWLVLRRVSHFRSEAPPALEAGAAVTASKDLVRGVSDWEKVREKAVMCIGGRTDPRVSPLNPAATLSTICPRVRSTGHRCTRLNPIQPLQEPDPAISRYPCLQPVLGTTCHLPILTPHPTSWQIVDHHHGCTTAPVQRSKCSPCPIDKSAEERKPAA